MVMLLTLGRGFRPNTPNKQTVRISHNFDPAGIHARLRSLGVRTLGDLQTLPQSLLTAVFGPVGLRLAKEANGLHCGTLAADRGRPDSFQVAQIHFSTPLTSGEGEKALRRALAVRALSKGFGAGRWFLSVCWSSGARATVSHPGPTTETWSTWLSLCDCLWSKLPFHRQGIREVELRFRGSGGGHSRQLGLFEEPREAAQLSRAISRIRNKVDPAFASASESLLLKWGASWGCGDKNKGPV